MKNIEQRDVLCWIMQSAIKSQEQGEEFQMFAHPKQLIPMICFQGSGWTNVTKRGRDLCIPYFVLLSHTTFVSLTKLSFSPSLSFLSIYSLSSGRREQKGSWVGLTHLRNKGLFFTIQFEIPTSPSSKTTLREATASVTSSCCITNTAAG